MGNLDAKRDWGHAKDYVIMQWLMLQQSKPEDYVIATGKMYTVREFIELSALVLNWNIKENQPAIIWEGKGLQEVGRRADTNEIVVRIDPRYLRPTEVDQLLGNAQKAQEKLGWVPKTDIKELVKDMIYFDKKEVLKEITLKKNNQ